MFRNAAILPSTEGYTLAVNAYWGEYPQLPQLFSNEQLAEIGINDSDIDAVLLTHLDCDHANGLKQVKGAKKFLVSSDEVKFAKKLTNKVRYYKGWWENIELTEFE